MVTDSRHTSCVAQQAWIKIAAIDLALEGKLTQPYDDRLTTAKLAGQAKVNGIDVRKAVVCVHHVLWLDVAPSNVVLMHARHRLYKNKHINLKATSCLLRTSTETLQKQ